jgi:hypothetical protein
MNPSNRKNKLKLKFKLVQALSEYQISNREATKNTMPEVRTSLQKSERSDHQN